MTLFANKHLHLHLPNIALVLATIWGTLALAATVYDVGRWFSAW